MCDAENVKHSLFCSVNYIFTYRSNYFVNLPPGNKQSVYVILETLGGQKEIKSKQNEKKIQNTKTHIYWVNETL